MVTRRIVNRMKYWSFFSNPNRWIKGHIRRGMKKALFGCSIAEYKRDREERKASKTATKSIGWSQCHFYV